MVTAQENVTPPELDLSIFGGILASIKNDADEVSKNPENVIQILTAPKAYKTLLNPETMSQFFLWFVQQDLRKTLENSDGKEMALPRHIALMAVSNQFRSENPPTTPNNGTHPLRKKEFDDAYGITKKHPQLRQTVALIHTGLSQYLGHLTKEILLLEDTNYINHYFSRQAKTLINEGIHNKALIQELLPTIAYSASQKESISSNFSSETASGLRLCFQRNAFNSIKENSETKEKTEHECPMKKIIGHMLNTTFERDESGELRLSDTPIPGALVDYIYQQLENAPTHSATNQSKPVQALS